MIVGATGESDRRILDADAIALRHLSPQACFLLGLCAGGGKYALTPLDTKPPLLREHRLYQADWLLRFYGFRAGELLDEGQPDFDPLLDPSAAGRCGTPTSSRSRSTARITKRCCAFPASAWSARSASLSRGAAGAARRGPQKSSASCSSGRSIFSLALAEAPHRCGSRSRGVRRNLTATERACSRRDRSTSSHSLSRHNEELFMTWREVVYEYDGSFDGLLCCIYESYTQKELPAAFFRTESSSHACMRSAPSRRTRRTHAAYTKASGAFRRRSDHFCAARTGHACPKKGSLPSIALPPSSTARESCCCSGFPMKPIIRFAARRAAAERRAGAIPRLCALFPTSAACSPRRSNRKTAFCRFCAVTSPALPR